MSQPYRETTLALPPASYKHSLWMRLLRWHRRLRRHFFGEYCNRRPWPCPKCGKRGTAYLYTAFGGVYSQKMVEHLCCAAFGEAHKTSQNYVPYSRQRQRRLNVEQVQQYRERAPYVSVPEARLLIERLKEGKP
jgi:hypothetical protein